MLNSQTKEHLNYFLAEKNLRLKNNFYSNVVYIIFTDCINIVMKKYRLAANAEDLRQDLQILLFEKIEIVVKANDCNAFIIRIIENYVKTQIKCLAKNSIIQKPGENYETISYQ